MDLQKKLLSSRIVLLGLVAIFLSMASIRNSNVVFAESLLSNGECRVTGGSLENSLLTVVVSTWKWGSIDKIVYKPDDADQVRPTAAPAPGFREGFLWGTWPGNPDKWKYKTKVLNDNTLQLQRESKGILLTRRLTIFPQRSILSFDIRIKNNRQKEVSDSYFNSLALVIGGVEKQYNPKAYVLIPQKGGGFASKQIISLGGRYKYKPFTPVLGMVDRGSRLMFLQVINKGRVRYHSLSVGTDRGSGKRTNVGIVFSPFDLMPGQTIEYQYDWVFIKGLYGLSGYSRGLAMDARLATKVYHPGEEAKVLIKFASAMPMTREIKGKLIIRDKDGKIVKKITRNYRLAISPEKMFSDKITWKVKKGSAIYRLEMLFSAGGKRIGRADMELKTTGITKKEVEKFLETARGKLTKVRSLIPYLGAEYPETFKQIVLAKYYGKKADEALQEDDITGAKTLVEKMKVHIRSGEKSARQETKTPFTPSLRSMSDRQAKPFCYAQGSELFTPKGNRLFLWGMMEGWSYNWVYDPLGKFTRKTPMIEKLESPRFLKLAIDQLLKEAKAYGNSVSLYISLNANRFGLPGTALNQAYLRSIVKVMQALKRQHIWVTPEIRRTERAWEDYLVPALRKRRIAGWKWLATNFGQYKNITYYVIPTAEPLIPGNQEKLIAPYWTKYILKKYGSFKAVNKIWAKNGQGLTKEEWTKKLLHIPLSVKQGNKYSIRTGDYEEFLSSLMSTMVEGIYKAIRSAGDEHMLFLGISTWSSRPLSFTSFFGKYAVDPRFAGFAFDKYIGHNWGAVSNPPEIWAEGQYQIYGRKPLVIDEWGNGTAWSSAPWQRAFYSTQQAWGRYFAGLKVRAFMAWAGGGAPWSNMFDQKTGQPLPVTQKLIKIRNELIANPIPKNLQVLIVGNRKTMPLYLYGSIIRLAAYLPQVKVDFDIADEKDLQRWNLKPYKLIICYTEGMQAKDIVQLRNFKGKVLLLGRPALTPNKSGVTDWINAGLFLKDKDQVEWQGRGAVVTSKVKVLRNIGDLKAGTEFKHIFGQHKSAWVPKAALRDDVEVLAETGKDAVLMKQGNLYWWTDMLGMETLDLPAYAAPPYPQIRESEKTLLNAMFGEAGVSYDISPLQVWIVNDIAYSYNTATGRIRVHNPGTIEIPKGMFLSSYERFRDGIIAVVAGTPSGNENFVKIRCNAGQVNRVEVNAKTGAFQKIDARHIQVRLKGNKTRYDIKVYFK